MKRPAGIAVAKQPAREESQCASAGHHGGDSLRVEMVGTRLMAGLTFHNRSINEGVTHENLCRHVSQPRPSHCSRRKRAGSTTSRSGGVWKIRTSRTRTTDARSLPTRWSGIRCEGPSGRAHHSVASGAGHGSLKIRRFAISRPLYGWGAFAALEAAVKRLQLLACAPPWLLGLAGGQLTDGAWRNPGLGRDVRLADA